MSESPYAPPAARVGDPPQVVTEKPSEVRRAVTCLWLSAALALILTAVDLATTGGGGQLLVEVSTAIITAVLLGLVAAKLAAGRSWPRWFFAVLYALGTAMTAVFAFMAPQAYLALPPFAQASMLVQFALQTAALVLMFTPAAGDWLR